MHSASSSAAISGSYSGRTRFREGRSSAGRHRWPRAATVLPTTAKAASAHKENHIMIIKGKLLIGVAIGAVAMFLIADPLGDAHHGIGQHNKFAADLGNILFYASLLTAVALIVLIVIALFQRVLRSRRART